MENFGIDPFFANYIILPVLVFFARILDVSIANVMAEGQFGPVNILFTVIKRQQLKQTLEAIKRFNPKAFYTVEQVKGVSDIYGMYSKERQTYLNFLHLKRR